LSTFSFHVVEFVEDKASLIQREQHYIDETESHKRANGYNISPVAGSTLGFRHSDEAKVKISKAQSGTKPSDEHRQKLSEALRGRKFSNESRARMSASRCGEKNHMWGKKHSDKTRAKMSVAHRGVKHHFWGKKHSDETKAKMVEKRLRWWKRYYAKRDELQLMLDF
jgi:group I intron endonuclease